MQVELLKKNGKYVDKKDGKEKSFTNFFLRCGDELVPVEVCFFPQEKFDGRDPNYNGRKKVLSAFAAILPDKPENGKTGKPVNNVDTTVPNNAVSSSGQFSVENLPF